MKEYLTNNNVIEGGTYETAIGDITITLLQKETIKRRVKEKGKKPVNKILTNYIGYFYINSIGVVVEFHSLYFINSFIQNHKDLKPYQLCKENREVNKCEECYHYKKCNLKGGKNAK